MLTFQDPLLYEFIIYIVFLFIFILRKGDRVQSLYLLKQLFFRTIKRFHWVTGFLTKLKNIQYLHNYLQIIHLSALKNRIKKNPINYYQYQSSNWSNIFPIIIDRDHRKALHFRHWMRNKIEHSNFEILILLSIERLNEIINLYCEDETTAHF